MAYITSANQKRIIFESEIKGLDLTGEIYKIPIYFFSKYEENQLLAIQELLKDPEKYFNTIYKPYTPVDTFTMVYEGRYPSYHRVADCPKLTSNYENFEIPQKIRAKGKAEILKFREWFETVKHLLEKPDIFVMRLHSRWGIVTKPKAITADNSGTVEMENPTIEELEQRIDFKIKEAGRFYYKDHKHTTILRRFSKCTFLAYKAEPIEGNDTGYSDEEVKEFLRNYDMGFKKPLKQMLTEYYRLKFNPEIKMEGKILEMLGFRACRHCYQV